VAFWQAANWASHPNPNPSEPSCIATMSLLLSCSLLSYSRMSSWLKQVWALGSRSWGPYDLWIWNFWGPEMPCNQSPPTYCKCLKDILMVTLWLIAEQKLMHPWSASTIVWHRHMGPTQNQTTCVTITYIILSTSIAPSKPALSSMQLAPQHIHQGIRQKYTKGLEDALTRLLSPAEPW